jgi:hypothetical protein
MTSTKLAAVVAFAAAPVVLVAMLPGCGEEREAYKPRPAYSGKAANLPPVPQVTTPKKNPDGSYSIKLAIHDLRSRIKSAKLLEQEQITIEGYIVKTNLMDAPPCAVHKTGKADGKDCEKTPPPVPTFWIADEKGASDKDAIRVMGWASNFAKLFDALQKYKMPPAAQAADKDKGVAKDDTWGVTIPNPLPAKDAKVKVTGKYSTSFTLASSGPETDPLSGIITYKTMEYMEPPPTPGTLPGLKD